MKKDLLEKWEKEDQKIRKKWEAELLSELLFLNYKYYNTDLFTTNGFHIYNTLNDQIAFNDKDIKDIRENAIELLEKNHKLKVDDFENLHYVKVNK